MYKKKLCCPCSVDYKTPPDIGKRIINKGAMSKTVKLKLLEKMKYFA